MDIIKLKYFCDAAESENFSQTAARFNVPTSSISQVIRRLENDMGTPLFDRRGNRIRLNAKGRILYRHAKTAMAALTEAKRVLSDGEEEVSGELRIFVGCDRAAVARAIERFRAAYPEVSFSLDHHRMTDPSEYDLIISDSVDSEDYAKRLLVREKLVFAVNAAHPLADRERVNVSELAETRFITMHEDSSLSRLFYRVCRAAGFEPRVVIRCADPAYLRRYVEMGLGAILYPAYSWSGLFSGGVVQLKPRNPIYRETFVFWRTDCHLSRGAKLFRECLEETFSEGKS